MRLCIVGGALQGMEAVFLAGKAGYETVLIDRRADAPALSLCDEPHVLDAAGDPAAAMELISTCDAVLPAFEDRAGLGALDAMMRGSDVPLLFDLAAYDVTSSKIESNRLMASVGAPLPADWPGCGFPAVVKPSSQSGSVGVTVAHDAAEMEAGLAAVRRLGDEPVVQEFVRGRSVSVEVVGDGRNATPYVTTEVVLDAGYDCKEVRCSPSLIDPESERRLAECSRRIAETLGLNGLMDAEAVLTRRGLRFLEVDARIPSQTPAAVLAATGVNLLERLAASRLGGEAPARRGGSSVYWHLHFKDGVMETTGEKGFSHVSAPRSEPGLFGSDDSISDYSPGKGEWRGTFIVSAGSPGEAAERREAVVREAMDRCGCGRLVDLSPEEA